jgi:hypothetical protein
MYLAGSALSPSLKTVSPSFKKDKIIRKGVIIKF